MQQPLFEILEEEKNQSYGRFVITPLEQGYGNTLGNSLRRVLLTSIPGAAITSVKISGVKHHFSTLKGMKEDVVELVLNLKKVRIKYTGTDIAKASLNVEGPKTVTAGDLEIDSQVTVVNPDLVIATVNKGAKLSAKLEIQSGQGYSLAEERKTNEIGLIPLDASFSPVSRVNYRVEETRVGRVTNYDKLVMEIWTDGSIDPKDALLQSAQIFTTYLNQLVNPTIVEKPQKREDDTLGLDGKLSVEEIGLPTRVANALQKAGFATVEDLAHAKREDLIKVRNLGEKSIKIINAALGERGIQIVIA